VGNEATGNTGNAGKIGMKFYPFFRLVSFTALLFSLHFTPAFASDEPFTYPSNWGGTGLMEIPTARLIKENTYRIGISQIEPYRIFYGAISPIKGLEIDGRITEILGTETTNPGWQNYGNYKDKSIDFKYQLIPEGKYMPAIALGIMDPHGTRIYSSQYVALSKQIYPFDFTIGFGNGRFGKTPLPSQGEGIKIEMISSPGEWLDDSQPFWGLQFAPSEKYALMLEYSPIRYHKQTNDPAQSKYFQEEVQLNYNFGFRWKPVKWAEIDLSYQRGDEIGVNFSMPFEFGKPLIPIYDRPYREKPADKLNPLTERIITALYNSGFSDIGVLIEGDVLWIEAQNNKYYFNTRAMGVIFRIVADMAPPQIRNINIVFKENGVPMLEFTTLKSDLTDMYEEKMSLNEFYHLSVFKTDVARRPDIRLMHTQLLSYGIKPSLQTFLNDPSGFFRYRLGALGWMGYHPWKGASFVAGLEGYPLNNVSSANEPLSNAVRSDGVLYKKESVALGRLMYDQIYKTENELYGRFAAGLLEVQYAGVDAEIGKPFFNGRFMLGLSGSAVKKREPNNPVQLKDTDVKDIYSTAFINTRLNIPEYDISVDLKTGRFLAGDKGTKITISKFINGVTLSVWYSITDTSGFNDGYNRGYHDKGIAVSIPLRLFKGTDSRTAYYYALSPWTRDVAQDIDHYNTLFDFIGRNTKIFLDKDKEKMY